MLKTFARRENLKVIKRRYFNAKSLQCTLVATLILASSEAGAGIAGNIVAYAGPGPGTGESAVAASLDPAGIAIDGSGNYYFTTSDSRVWKVNPTVGSLVLVAGTGVAGYSGDGGDAVSAQLNNPTGLAVDGSGDIYIADTDNSRIRKVDHSTGNITSLSGDGTSAYAGDGGSAVIAQLNAPKGVAVDASGNVYIADSENFRVRKVNHSDGTISTIAGTGAYGYSGDGSPATSAKLNRPYGIAVDSSGNVFFADYNNHAIRKIDHTDGTLSTFAGTGTSGYSGDDGPASSAKLRSPYDVAVDSSGSVYIADSVDHRIRKVDSSTGHITTIAGTGTSGYSGDGGSAVSSKLYQPVGVAVDASGNVYVADYNNRRVRKVNHADGTISTTAGNGETNDGGDGDKALFAQFSSLCEIAFDSSNDLYIVDSGNNRIRKADSSTGIITAFAGNGSADYSGDGGSAAAAGLCSPYAVAIDASGDAYITDQCNDVIRKVNHTDGKISTFAGNGTRGYSGNGGFAVAAKLAYPSGIAVDASGDILFAETDNNVIRKVDHSSGILSLFAGSGTAGFSGDGGAATAAKLNAPYGVAIDASGNVYIADSANSRIRKVSHEDGKISTFAGNGTAETSGDGGPAASASLITPYDVKVDADGSVFIVDYDGNVIRKVDHADGTISTVAGIGTMGYSGDGGPAASAQFFAPMGAAIDSEGNLLIVDTLNSAIREVYQAGADKGAPSVAVGYGSSYADLSGSHAALNGNPYIRIKVQDGGSGQASSALTLSSLVNATYADAEEFVGGIFSPGVSSGTDNPVCYYLVKTATGSSSFTFSATDVAGNFGSPDLSVSTLSFAKGAPVQESDFRKVTKDRSKVSILASNGDLRNVVVTANGESIPVGTVKAGVPKVIEVGSRLRARDDNEITVTAEGDAGTEARTLASSATLESIDPSEAANRKVYARGDLNRDGRVTVKDAVKLLRIVSGLNPANPAEAMLGDVDLDGRLTILDVTRTLRTATGL